MSGPAYVHNTEVIETVKGALSSFAHQVDEGLTEISAECRRTLDWLEHDRPRFWKRQVRVAWDEVEQAKKNLHRRLMYPVGDERPSCTEERAALKKAQARLGYCEQKSTRLQDWCRQVRHELFEYEGRISQLKSLGEVEVAQAVAVLGRLLARIDDYHRMGSPTSIPKVDLSAMMSQITSESAENQVNRESSDPQTANDNVEETP